MNQRIEKPKTTNVTPADENYNEYWRNWWIYTAVTAENKEDYEKAMQTAQVFEDEIGGHKPPQKKDLRLIHKRMITMDIQEELEHIRKEQTERHELFYHIQSLEEKLELAIEALEEINKTYMKYIENEIECDSAAIKMDELAENTLKAIKGEV